MKRLLAATLKTVVVILAVCGFIPLWLGDFLIQRGGLSNA